jgi:hypothetical protein
MLVSFQAVSKQKMRHYSRLANNKIASCQQIYLGEEAVEVDALNQQFLRGARHAFWNRT